MVKLLKRIPPFVVPCLEVISTGLIVILSVVFSIWLTDEITASKLGISQQEQDLKELLTLDFAYSAIFDNIRNFSTPVPYLLIFIFISTFGRVESFFNRYQYGKYGILQSKNMATEKFLRKETQSHADTKSSYFDALADTLKYILTNEVTGFDHRCRVTVYRKQHDDDEHFLRQIFRHSPVLLHEQNGRFRIPSNQGVVGAAWLNHGVKEFSSEHPPDSEEFRNEMNAALQNEGCTHPEGPLSMASKHYYARALRDNEGGQRIGIVVYESTETGVLKVAGIDQVLDGESLDVARFVRLRGILHSEFNPDPEE
ncbi:hypothetical protein FIV06_02585 [Labrenzia sp. THAF191b]|uniref:hypothetical protein n=1 Tax=unclassified Labrenzia TaxID=2648686 RepID=UPI001267F171|nr:MULTISPECIES: hypothetical protein [unclassified Labrenzia]QFS96289.1 hypothetical protein FIV06_02585 [Labrenzia sp. THAF191b]QFT02604.1 hypothetical protein FIV05_02585 [Labrenzia sp. THAF191a]QFT14146.1 hypothetical protein FIV03_02590 [Labrenzia sp. THAF187b]